MSEERERELEERLEGAFTSSSPRPGFDQELWTRMQGQSSWWRRLWTVPERSRLVPALAGLAGLLVVVGLGYALVTRPAGPGVTAARNGAGPAPLLPANPLFGAVPVPGQPQRAQAAQLPAGADIGPGVRFTWAGKLPAVPASGLVYRYAEPSHADADTFAARLGAIPSGSSPGNPGLLGNYSGGGFRLAVLGTSKAGREPLFVYTPVGSDDPGGSGPAEDVARAAAARFVAAHNLPVEQPNQLAVQGFPGFPSVVYYYRQLSVDGRGELAPEVDAMGRQAGLSLTVKGDGSVFQASGPIPLSLESGRYPFRGAAAVTAGIPASNVLASQARTNLATVALTEAQLVYVVVPDGTHAFFEPAWLLSGKHNAGAGETVEEHVLVPAIDDSFLRR